MKLVYVAGPYRAPTPWQVEQNIRRAEALALDVWKLGAACICPHTNTRFFDKEADDSLWLAGDLEMLDRSDAVMAVPGWECSRGAQAEIAHTTKQGKPVFYHLWQLKAWLDSQP